MTKRFTVFQNRLLSVGLFAIAAATAVVSCGRAEDEVSEVPYRNVALPDAHPDRIASNGLASRLYAMAGGALAVKMESCTEGLPHSVDPANVPADGTRIDKITVKMCLKLNADSVTGFITNHYSTGKWGLRVIKPNTSGGLEQVDLRVFTTADTTNQLLDKTSGSNSKNGYVTFTINFSGKNETEIRAILDNWTQTVNGRKKITFQPFFYVGTAETPTFDTRDNIVWDPAVTVAMKTDVGVIRNAVTLSKDAQPSGGRLGFQWSLPTDTSSDDYLTTGKPVATNESSTVASVLLMVWSDEECRKSGWDFKTNDQVATPSQSLSCTYPTDMETSCALSAGACTGESGTIADQSPQTFAVPNLTSLPALNESVEVGCYRVYRVPSENSSRNVANLENGKLYGAMVWPIDSAGHIGAKRSHCAFGTPVEVPLATQAKSGVPNSKDCFVVTAASGNSNSRAVYYWRAVRDIYLEGTAFKRWYMRNGPVMAKWLEQQTSLKSPLESILAVSGWAIVEAHDASAALRQRLLKNVSVVFGSLSQLFFSTAEAAENTTVTSPAAPNQWSGSSWTNITFTGGLIRTSQDADYYDAFYDKRPPTRFMVSQTFRLVDVSGELNLGYGFSYTSLSGNVPETSPNGESINEKIVGRVISFYSLGAYGVFEYRYRVGVEPFLWPRLTIGGGVERTREEASMPSDYDNSNGEWDPEGTTVTAPLIFARLSVEFSLSELGIGDRQALGDGYGANEFALALYGEYISDLSSKRLSLSGLGVGAGISLLLP